MINHDYEIYLIAMIELLINGVDQVDLGNYVLEFTPNIVSKNNNIYYVLCARIRNLINNNIEWENIYCKYIAYMENKNLSDEELEQFKNYYINMLNDCSNVDKLKFILKPEPSLTKNIYQKIKLSSSTIASFFINFKKPSIFQAIPPLVRKDIEAAFLSTNMIIKKISENNKLKC